MVTGWLENLCLGGGLIGLLSLAGGVIVCKPNSQGWVRANLFSGMSHHVGNRSQMGVTVITVIPIGV